MPYLTPVARHLRNNPTATEQKLWRYLQRRQLHGLKFRRQYVIEKYIVDFACPEKRLIIEVDGGQHSINAKNDEERTRFLESRGFLVLRFWNNQIHENIEGVLETISKTVNPLPNPPP